MHLSKVQGTLAKKDSFVTQGVLVRNFIKISVSEVTIKARGKTQIKPALHNALIQVQGKLTKKGYFVTQGVLVRNFIKISVSEVTRYEVN